MSNNNDERKNQPYRHNDLRYTFMYFLAALVFIQLIQWAFLSQQIKELTYSEFKATVKEGRIIEVALHTDWMEGVMKPPPSKDGGKQTSEDSETTPPKGTSETGEDSKEEELVPFQTARVEDENLLSLLDEHGVTYRRVVESKIAEIFWTWILPFGIIIGLWYFLMKRMGQGASNMMSFGKSKAKIYGEKDTGVTFNDVAGCEEAKEELQEVIHFLRNPQKFTSVGANIPKGVLLTGPPGTGKTLLGKAIAGEARVPFYYISGSDFVEMFVGVGASKVRDLFKQAKENSPCIVFIDELDAVGRHRGAGLGGGHDEREQTLNQLLVEMDGFETNKGVIILGATNRSDVLDPALLRPGRFDRRVTIDSVSAKAREEILSVHAKDRPMAKDVDLSVIARRTPGFSGADLANVINEGALQAARKNKTRIDMQDLEEAIDRVIAGPQTKSRIITEKERRIVAFHESGHALIGMKCENTDPVHKVSIVPRGQSALGFTMQLPEEEKFLASKEELLDRICVLLGGRATEEIFMGSVSTGAHDDLEKATQIARAMVCEYGMSEELGHVRYGRRQAEIFLARQVSEEKNFSEATAEKIDREIRHIIDRAYMRAKEMIKTHRDRLEQLANKLLEDEVLEHKDVQKILETEEQPEQRSQEDEPEEEAPAMA